MSTNVYNVIWADDEYLSLKEDDEIRRYFLKAHIEVLAYVPTSGALRIELEHYKDKVDAVIIDGNFSKSDVDYVEPDDISGLIDTLTFIEKYNIKRDIPFFLYTSKKVFLQEFCKNGELAYFLPYRLIQKGEIEVLTNKIIKDVDHIHSIEHMVNSKYQFLLKKVKEIDEDGAELLHQFLLDEARDRSFDKSVALFNQLRGIMEKLKDKCRDNDIVPQSIKTLNNFKSFFTFNSYYDRNKESYKEYWKGYGDYKPNDNVMPKVLGYTIEKLIDIIQDGSHKNQDLNLGVSEYVQNAHSPFLFRSCLYQVVDLLSWYNKTIEALKNNNLKYPLYSRKQNINN